MPDIFVRPKTNPPVDKPDFPHRHGEKKERRGGHHVGFLSTFALSPQRIHYKVQEEDEKIILFLRQHLFTNFKWLVVTLILILVPVFALAFFSFNGIPLNFRYVIFIAWYLLTFAYAFEHFIIWFFNIHIVTNQRVIDVSLPSILIKDISETTLENVQDVSSKTGGFMRSFLNYGDIYIQTAGSLPEFVFEAVPKSDTVAEIINDAISGEEGYQHNDTL